MTLDSLPILDISQLDSGEEAADAFRSQLREVTHEVGFFYLVGHGIPQDLIDEVLDLSAGVGLFPASLADAVGPWAG